MIPKIFRSLPHHHSLPIQKVREVVQERIAIAYLILASESNNNHLKISDRKTTPKTRLSQIVINSLHLQINLKKDIRQDMGEYQSQFLIIKSYITRISMRDKAGILLDRSMRTRETL